MKHLLILSVFTVLLFAGCRREKTIEPPKSPNHSQAEVALAKKRLLSLIREHNLSTGFGVQTQTSASNGAKRSGSEGQVNLSSIADYSYNQFLIQKAINPDDYECGPTLLDEYFQEHVASWTEEDFFLFFFFSSVVFDAAYIYDNTDGGQYYGPNGEFTNVTNRTFKDLKRFWNIPNDILIRDCHGNLYNNVSKVTDVLMVYGYPEEDAQIMAELLQTVFGSDNFSNFNNPLLTFNAFAAPADPYFETVKKIVMGDGIMMAYDDMGFGTISTQAILAHEYGHHVQFANNVDFGTGPEGTRRTELMADALSAYFLTHKKGCAANWKKVQEFLQVFYTIGDCAFDNPGHHGTPNQRMKAAAFGYKIASDAQTQGKILKSEDFIALFDDELNEIIAPD